MDCHLYLLRARVSSDTHSACTLQRGVITADDPPAAHEWDRV
jgi:hypothetical protein